MYPQSLESPGVFAMHIRDAMPEQEAEGEYIFFGFGRRSDYGFIRMEVVDNVHGAEAVEEMLDRVALEIDPEEAYVAIGHAHDLDVDGTVEAPSKGCLGKQVACIAMAIRRGFAVTDAMVFHLGTGPGEGPDADQIISAAQCGILDVMMLLAMGPRGGIEHLHKDNRDPSKVIGGVTTFEAAEAARKPRKPRLMTRAQIEAVRQAQLRLKSGGEQQQQQ